ncbi:MAG: NAD-dependent epimerase/dehydratase family protein [Myxococcota bacterium]
MALVTGGAGFIGSHLVRRLLADGWRVRVLDNFDTGHRSNLDGLAVDVLEGDLRTDCEAAVAGCSRVFHLAAIASVPRSVAHPDESFAVNALGTSRLFEASRRAGVSRVVCASSAAVYGPTGAVVSEDQVLRPQSPYGAEKAAMEHLATAYGAALGLEVVCLRFFNVYGPRQDPSSAYAGVIAAFCAALAAGRVPVVHGDGSQSRDFVYVSDVVDALVLAADHGVAGVPYNVGTGRPTSVIELLRNLQAALDAPPDATFGDRRAGDLDRSCADVSRLATLGFRAQVDLAEGLLHTGRWYREHFASR